MGKILTWGFVALWWLTITLHVLAKYLINLYIKIAKVLPPEAGSGWDLLFYLGSSGNAFVLVPVLAFHPHCYRLVSERMWLLHSIGIVTIAISLSLPLFYDDKIVLRTLDNVGDITGRAAGIYAGMLLLATARKSAILAYFDVGYIDLLALHRVAGWWCVAHSLIHTFAYLIFYYMRYGFDGFVSTCFPVSWCWPDPEKPCLNTLGLVNFFGIPSAVGVATLAIFSNWYMRRYSYNTFYSIHLASAVLFMLFAALHCFCMMMFMFAAFPLYALDRWVARRTRVESADVMANILCRSPSSNLAILTWPTIASSDLEPGTRWVYLCLQNSCGAQWHPVSVIHRGQSMYAIIKGLGSWSLALNDSAASGELVRMKIEGPFGRQLCNSGLQDQHPVLILVAGGVGISPFVDLLCNLQLSSHTRWRHVRLIWAVRGHEYDALSALLDLKSLSQVADISVFVTSTAEESASKLDMPEPEKAVGPPSYKLGVLWDGPREVGSSRLQLFCALLGSTIVIAACGLSSSYVRSRIFEALRGKVHTLTAYTLYLRLAPILVAILFVAIAAVWVYAIQLAAQPSKKQAAEHSLREVQLGVQLESMEPMPRALQVVSSRPDVEVELRKDAKLGPICVQVCGPERLNDAATTATRNLKSEGHDIELTIHESTW